MIVDILNSEKIKNTFSKLKPDATPVFGKMTPQHVVEHLTKVVKASCGKFEVKLYLTTAEAEILKQKLIYSDAELPQGIKNPLLGDDLPVLNHPDLNIALTELFREIKKFENNLLKTPDAKNMHPRMGELKYSEWLTFHNKHFLHHFRQYALV